VDEKGLSVSLPGACGQIGSNAGPLLEARRTRATSSFSRLRRVQRLPAEPLRKHSFTIYSGTEQRVREGFSMALRALGMEADLQPNDSALLPAAPTKEKN